MNTSSKKTPTPLWRLNSWAGRFSNNNANQTWRGIIHPHFDPAASGVPCVLKALDTAQRIAAELACALASQTLKVPVPNGYLVQAPIAHLDGAPQWLIKRADANANILLFGSELRQPDTPGDVAAEGAEAEYIWRKLCNTTTGSIGGVFDELVLNQDRHSGNVVHNNGRWWLIDHDDATHCVSELMRDFANAQSNSRSELAEFSARANSLAAEMLKRRRTNHGMDKLGKDWQRAQAQITLRAREIERWQQAANAPNSQLSQVCFFTAQYLHLFALRLPALAHLIAKRCGTITQPPLRFSS